MRRRGTRDYDITMAIEQAQALGDERLDEISFAAIEDLQFGGHAISASRHDTVMTPL
jgi:hypothetical protein